MNPQGRIHKWSTSLIILCLIPGLTGCDSLRECSTTCALWDNERAEGHRHPAEKANLNLAKTPDSKDVLVEYDEVYERTGKVTRRAFLLNQNEKRLAENRKPHFVSAGKASKLRATPIEVSTETKAQPVDLSQMYALLGADGWHFTFIIGGKEAGTYALPNYINGSSHTLRIALTPVTVTCDAVIYTVLAGTVVGIVAVCMYGGGSSMTLNP
jgi:hypothetical protein